jgi:hypothetical protein
MCGWERDRQAGAARERWEAEMWVWPTSCHCVRWAETRWRTQHLAVCTGRCDHPSQLGCCKRGVDHLVISNVFFLVIFIVLVTQERSLLCDLLLLWFAQYSKPWLSVRIKESKMGGTCGTQRSYKWKRNECNSLAGECQGKLFRWRLQVIWEDNIRVDLMAVVCESGWTSSI